MYENAATVEQQVTPFPLWRGVLETLRHWASLLTTCEHRNLSNHGPCPAAIAGIASACPSGRGEWIHGFLASGGALMQSLFEQLPTPSTSMFAGAEYSEARDGERLLTQVDRIRGLAIDGKWRTIQRLAEELRKLSTRRLTFLRTRCRPSSAT